MQDVGVRVVKGGMHNVSRSLADVLRSHGGEVRVRAAVAEIECENGRAKAVRLASGERIALDGVVASNVDPRHLALDLLGEATLGSGITEKIKRYEWGSSFFVIYAALDRPVSYRAGSAADSAGYVHAVGQKLDSSPRPLPNAALACCRPRPCSASSTRRGSTPRARPRGGG